MTVGRPRRACPIPILPTIESADSACPTRSRRPPRSDRRPLTATFPKWDHSREGDAPHLARHRHSQPVNGHGHQPASRLSSLKEQVEESELRARLAQSRLAESVFAPFGYGGSWGDVANPFGYRLDASGGLWLPLAAGSLYSRQQGRNRPFAWADIDLDNARSLARWLAAKNDIAIGCLGAIVNFTVKKGYVWEARPSAGHQKSPAVAQLAARVQRLIDDHSDVNNLPSRERSACRRAVRDGEVFVRHFAQQDGSTLVRFVEPEQVREQSPAGHDPNGANGIITAPGDVEDVRGYSITYDGSGYDIIDAAEVSHYKRNVDECVKRGLPDFFSTGESLDGVAKLLQNMRLSGAAQAAIAWTEQFKGATRSQIESLVASTRDINRGTFTGPVSGRDVSHQQLVAPVIRKVGEGMEQVAAPVPVGASVHIQIVQAALRAIGCRWNMPEYMVSGDSSGANFAGTLVAGSPFVNSIECEQADLGLFLLRWRWIAIRNACEVGLLAPYTFEQIEELIDLHFTPPQVAVAKEAEQATIDHEDIAAGVMSLQTRRARRGLDDEQERENLKKEPPTRLAQRAQDLDPSGNPVGGFGRGQQSAKGGGIKSALPPPAPPGSKDGEKAGNPFAALAHESWNEGDHPRGQPGNAGQFGPGGGGGGGDGASGDHKVARPIGKIQTREGAIGKALDFAGGVGAATKAAASRLGEAAWASLNPDEQRLFTQAYAVGKWLLHHAETGMRAGKAVAIEAARQRGLSSEAAKRVGRVVGIVDTIASWTVNVPATTVLTGNPLAGKAAGLLPVGSMAYLAYSTARNPLATLRAAKAALHAVRQPHHESQWTEATQEVLEDLVEGMKGARDPEWFVALVLAALDDADGDITRAIKAARDALANTPSGPVEESADPEGEADEFARLLEARDDSGHEHASDGKFTGPGGGGRKADKSSSSSKDKKGSTSSRSGDSGSKKDSNSGQSAAVAGKKDSVSSPSRGLGDQEDAASGESAVDPDAHRPSRPENRHKNKDGSAPAPVAKPWRAPPPKIGKKGEGMKARPRGDESQTKTGDVAEALSVKLGFRSILPEDRRSNTNVELEGSSIDVEYDHSGRAYEIKMCNTTATEYRLKAKAKEKDDKLEYARKHDLTPHVMVAVRDVDTFEIHYYAAKEPGMTGAEVSEAKFDYVGTASYASHYPRREGQS